MQQFTLKISPRHREAAKRLAVAIQGELLTRYCFFLFFLFLITASSFTAAYASETANSPSLFKQEESSHQDLYPFPSPNQTYQFQTLTKEIRCLVCQNQNIADSNAPLAKDLRAKVYTLLQTGHSPEEIKAYLAGRYGDFILLKPRFNFMTLALWIWPLVLGCLLFFILNRATKKAKKSSC